MNVDKIQGNQASLEGKLAYEREKLGQYSAVLEEHEARCVCWGWLRGIGVDERNMGGALE